MTETWKPVPEWEGIYEVSDLGRVRRIAAGTGTHVGRILRPMPSSHGYATVGLNYPGYKPRRMPIHGLVAAAFIGPRPNKAEVNHKNGDRMDASLNNLEYVTRSDNLLHAYRVLGRSKNAKPGETNPKAKLTTDLVSEIRRLYEAGGETHRSLAVRFGVAVTTVAFITQRRTWKDVA